MRTREELEREVSLVMAFGVGLSALLLASSLVFMALGKPNERVLAVMGILILVSTPVARVVMCLNHFTWQKDWKYVALTVWVLLAMLLGLAFGAV
jgi:uncharacterized membrane protein